MNPMTSPIRLIINRLTGWRQPIWISGKGKLPGERIFLAPGHTVRLIRPASVKTNFKRQKNNVTDVEGAFLLMMPVWDGLSTFRREAMWDAPREP
jgi:hypothetical protein